MTRKKWHIKFFTLKYIEAMSRVKSSVIISDGCFLLHKYTRVFIYSLMGDRFGGSGGSSIGGLVNILLDGSNSLLDGGGNFVSFLVIFSLGNSLGGLLG